MSNPFQERLSELVSLSESFEVVSASGKVISVEYSEGAAKAKAADHKQKTGESCTVRFKREAAKTKNESTEQTSEGKVYPKTVAGAKAAFKKIVDQDKAYAEWLQKKKEKEAAQKKESVDHLEEEKHRVAVSVSDPNHTAVSRRKEVAQKYIRLSAESTQKAIEKAKAHYKKAGYKVYGAEHVGIVKEGVNEASSSSKWRVSYDYGPHQSAEVEVRAKDEKDAIKKGKDAAKKRGHHSPMINHATKTEVSEKTLTPTELKKREEVATAMELDKPGMDMSKKMAIATAVAKRVAEDLSEQMMNKKGPWSIQNTKTGQVYLRSEKRITKEHSGLKAIHATGGDHKHATIHYKGKPVTESLSEEYNDDDYYIYHPKTMKVARRVSVKSVKLHFGQDPKNHPELKSMVAHADKTHGEGHTVAKGMDLKHTK
jgi:hypothetical protein